MKPNSNWPTAASRIMRRSSNSERPSSTAFSSYPETSRTYSRSKLGPTTLAISTRSFVDAERRSTRAEMPAEIPGGISEDNGA